jgi:hypothetical protein
VLAETLSILAAVSMAIGTAALLLLHVLPTGYDPVRDAVSDYAIGRYRAGFWVITGTAIATGIAIAGPRLQHIFGLIERLYYLSSIAWLLAVSVELARLGG